MFQLSNIPKLPKAINLNKTVIIILATFLLIIGFSFFYRLVIFPHQNQKTLGACVLQAEMNYQQQWTVKCLALYSPQVIQEDGEAELCQSLDPKIAAPILRNYKRQIDDCLNRYPDNPGK